MENIGFILLIVAAVIAAMFSPEPEQSEPQDVEPGWLSYERKQPTNDDDWNPTVRAEEPKPETHMQKFRRENSMREVVKRGGYLTTGERMEAMYGDCEEAAQCFPEDYYR